MKIRFRRRHHHAVLRISRRKAIVLVTAAVLAVCIGVFFIQAKADDSEELIIEEPTVVQSIIEEPTIEETSEITTEEPTETTTEEIITEEEVEDGAWFQGKFYPVLWYDEGIVTGYCPYCNGEFEIDPENGDWGTASGLKAIPYRTCATDVFPEGSLLMIEGVDLIEGVVWRAEDTGGLIDGNDIDVFLDNHEDEEQVGNLNRRIKVLRWGW
ncbi:MAG: 3D domain-containing protein [Clostridia bacterium]|nr:3D domain-containing protein [Clostridia bacterium]MBR3133278.1 3D domain-containing protein [Clostridia bacterium]